MTDYIRIRFNDSEFKIPNRWELLTDEFQYQMLVGDLLLMAEGKLSPAMVRVNYVCRFFGWKYKKINGEDAFANLALID